ncbi:DNA polymerase alpha subunit B, partial [Spiromyces aspiralis]
LYPLYPPHESVNLSLAHDARMQLTAVPDVLVLPSQLHYFAKQSDDIVCINPGKVSKGLTGGTYVRLWVHDPDAALSQAGQRDLVSASMPDLVVSRPSERIRAEIVRV